MKLALASLMLVVTPTWTCKLESLLCPKQLQACFLPATPKDVLVLFHGTSITRTGYFPWARISITD